MKRAAEFVALVLAFLSLHTALNGFAHNVNSVDRADVSAFLGKIYFPTAIAHPESALSDLTTENFKGLSVGEPTQYVRFWKRVAKVEELEVEDELTNSKNKFDVHWKFYFNDGTKPENASVRFHVRCASAASQYLPWASCDPKDIRIDDDQKIRK